MWVAFFLAVIALGERLIFDLGPNIELVTTSVVIAGLYLPLKYRLLIPFAIMAISDSVLGFGAISIFTWSGFMLMGFLPPLISKLTNSTKILITGTGAGLVGNLIFFWWTNLGVWLTDSFGMYGRDLSGLILCFYNALPFLRLQMTSTLMFLPISILIIEEIKVWQSVRRLERVR